VSQEIWSETSAQANTKVKILALTGKCAHRFFKSIRVCLSRTKKKRNGTVKPLEIVMAWQDETKLESVGKKG
jgi:hypothetical protein